MTRLTLLSRSYCHLCDDMIAALESFQGRFSSPLEIEVIDIDRHPSLEAKWGEKVPVLLGADLEICHYHLDETALKKYLGAE